LEGQWLDNNRGDLRVIFKIDGHLYPHLERKRGLMAREKKRKRGISLEGSSEEPRKKSVISSKKGDRGRIMRKNDGSPIKREDSRVVQ